MKNKIHCFIRPLLKILAIWLIKYLQRKYKYYSLNNYGRQTNQLLIKLKLIQAILYYFKSQFKAWGYFHYSCVWSNEDKIYFDKLFPQKDFKEIDSLIYHNPEAITYYHNKIWDLSKKNLQFMKLKLKSN